MPYLPSVAIVILNWNGKQFLEQFLPSVTCTTYNNYSIIIADNASEDDSVLFVQENYPQIKILQNTINEGFAKGYNIALKQVDADYYVLLNSDVEVQPGWMEPVIELMESDAIIAACQPKILSYQNKKKFEYAGACGGWVDSVGYPFNRGRIFDICEFDEGQYDQATPVFWATGAAFFVRAEIFNLMEGFDEFFFAHQEEIDLCWRMQLAGYKIFVQPASVVYHVGGGTLPMGNKTKVFLNFRNNLVMLTKNLPASNAIWKVPFRIGLDNIAAWKGLLTGSSVTFIAIVKAHIHYLKWLFFYRQKKILLHKRNKQMQGNYRGLVIWDYFVKRKKTFSEIVSDKK
ncbi:MAG: glycosyltransferase family 2 protein [Ginsengibacter sp.]